MSLGAGVTDSCATCHGRPRGSAGFGGDVVTRPDSRDAPHLFGVGIKEMLADEITTDLRAIRAGAITQAQASSQNVSRQLNSKNINYGRIIARPNGTVDVSQIKGVDTDLRVKPFFHHGATTSIHEFVVGAFNDEMGMQAVDPELLAAHNGGRFVTVGGMVLDGAKDTVKAPPTDNPSADVDGDGIANEIPASIVDHTEFYLLNYFKPATYEQTEFTRRGRELFEQVGCATCHTGYDASIKASKHGYAKDPRTPAAAQSSGRRPSPSFTVTCADVQKEVSTRPPSNPRLALMRNIRFQFAPYSSRNPGPALTKDVTVSPSSF